MRPSKSLELKPKSYHNRLNLSALSLSILLGFAGSASADTFEVGTPEEYLARFGHSSPGGTIKIKPNTTIGISTWFPASPNLINLEGSPDGTSVLDGLEETTLFNGDLAGSQVGYIRHVTFQNARGLGAVNIYDSHGPIEKNIFVNNRADSSFSTWAQGGGLRINNGGLALNDNSFISNYAGLAGGAAALHNFQGSLSQNSFINNIADGAGGALSIHTEGHSLLKDNYFSGNRATGLSGFNAIPFNLSLYCCSGNGGAVLWDDFNGAAVHNVFYDNSAAHYGGGAFLADSSPYSNNAITSNLFLKNKATVGGALVLHSINGYVDIADNVFLGNSSVYQDSLPDVFVIPQPYTSYTPYYDKFAKYSNGKGSAIYIADSHRGYIRIRSSHPDKKTLFYGNRQHHPIYGTTTNSIHFGAGPSNKWSEATNLNISGPGSILMLDPLSSHQNIPREEGDYLAATSITKTDTGSWYLGGNSQMWGGSRWYIGDGALTLTTVDGEEAAVHLKNYYPSNFVLDAAGTLSGTGTIEAGGIGLYGTLAPDTWVKTGLTIDEILALPNLENLNVEEAAALVDVVKSSEYGSLTFKGEVFLDDATYLVDVNYDTGEHDQLSVEGDLWVDTTSTIKINSLTFNQQPVSDDNLPSFRVITTTEGIENGDLLELEAADSADYLLVSSKVDETGKHLDMKIGLRWFSNAQDDAGNMLAHGDFNVADAFTLNGNLTTQAPTAAWDGNTLTKLGTGTLTLNGSNTYTGITTIKEGTLRLGDSAHAGASLEGDVVVGSAGTLTGLGTVYGNATIAGRLAGNGTIQGSLDLLDGAVVAPGFSIGTITVGGLNLTSNSTYEVEIDEHGASDKILVRSISGSSGVAYLNDAKLRILNYGSSNSNDWNLDTTYTIIETDNGVQGTFGTVENVLAFLDPTVIYNPKNVQLRMLRNDVQFSDVCQTYNQCGVGGGLNALPVDSPVPAAIVKLTPDQARAAYESMAGDVYGSTRSALGSNRLLRDSLNQRMLGYSPYAQDKAALWFSSWGHSGHLHGTPGVAKATHSGTGFVLGAERNFGKALVGASASAEVSKITSGGVSRSLTKADSYSVGGYLATNIDNFEVRTGLAYSALALDTERDIWIGSMQDKAKSKMHGHKVQIFAEGAKTFNLTDKATVAPYLNVAQNWIRTPAVTENGSIASLDIEAKTDRILQTTVGVRGTWKLDTVKPVYLTGDVGWMRTSGDVQSKTTNRFTGTQGRFTVKGAGVDRNTVMLGAGIQVGLGKNASLNIGYEGQIGSQHKAHAGKARLNVRF